MIVEYQGERSTAENLDILVGRVVGRAVVTKVTGATRLEAIGGLLRIEVEQRIACGNLGGKIKARLGWSRYQIQL